MSTEKPRKKKFELNPELPGLLSVDTSLDSSNAKGEDNFSSEMKTESVENLDTAIEINENDSTENRVEESTERIFNTVDISPEEEIRYLRTMESGNDTRRGDGFAEVLTSKKTSDAKIDKAANEELYKNEIAKIDKRLVELEKERSQASWFNIFKWGKRSTINAQIHQVEMMKTNLVLDKKRGIDFDKSKTANSLGKFPWMSESELSRRSKSGERKYKKEKRERLENLIAAKQSYINEQIQNEVFKAQGKTGEQKEKSEQVIQDLMKKSLALETKTPLGKLNARLERVNNLPLFEKYTSGFVKKLEIARSSWDGAKLVSKEFATSGLYTAGLVGLGMGVSYLTKSAMLASGAGVFAPLAGGLVAGAAKQIYKNWGKNLSKKEYAKRVAAAAAYGALFATVGASVLPYFLDTGVDTDAVKIENQPLGVASESSIATGTSSASMAAIPDLSEIDKPDVKVLNETPEPEPEPDPETVSAVEENVTETYAIPPEDQLSAREPAENAIVLDGQEIENESNAKDVGDVSENLEPIVTPIESITFAKGENTQDLLEKIFKQDPSFADLDPLQQKVFLENLDANIFHQSHGAEFTKQLADLLNMKTSVVTSLLESESGEFRGKTFDQLVPPGEIDAQKVYDLLEDTNITIRGEEVSLIERAMQRATR